MPWLANDETAVFLPSPERIAEMAAEIKRKNLTALAKEKGDAGQRQRRQGHHDVGGIRELRRVRGHGGKILRIEDMGR